MLLDILSRHKNTNTAVWGYICTSCYVSCIFSFVCTIKPQLVSFSSTPLSSMTQLLRKGVINVTSLMSRAFILSTKHPQSSTICRSFPVCIVLFASYTYVHLGHHFQTYSYSLTSCILIYLTYLVMLWLAYILCHFNKIKLFPSIIALALYNLYCYA